MGIRAKKGTSYKHDIVLFDDQGNKVTGVVPDDVDLHYLKPGASNAVKKTIDSSNFEELDSTDLPGIYRVTFSSSEMDTAGYFTATVKPSSNAQTSFSTYNIRFEVVRVRHTDLSDEHFDILSAISDLEVSSTTSTQSGSTDDLPTHYVSDVKQSSPYTFAFRVLGPAGPVTGITSSDIAVTLLKDGAKASGSVESALASTLTEIDANAAPGWYSMELQSGQTDTLGDLTILVDFSGVSVSQDSAEVQDTPTKYTSVPAIFMRDGSEGFAVTSRDDPEAGGQLMETTDGGDTWSVISTVENEENTDYIQAGYYDVDGLDPNPGEVAAIGSFRVKNPDIGRLLTITQNYGPSLENQILQTDDTVGLLAEEDLLFPTSLSDLTDRSWYSFYSEEQQNGLLVSSVGVWDRNTRRVYRARGSTDIKINDVYADAQQDNTPSDQVLQSSQDVQSSAAVYNDIAAGFQRVVFKDETSGELVYIDNEGGSFGPRSVIEANADSPNIFAWDTDTANPVLGVIYRDLDTGAIKVAQYDFSTGTSVTSDPSRWTTAVLDDSASFGAPSIAVNSSNDLFLTYTNASRTELYYQTNRSGSYEKETVWTSGGTEIASIPSITIHPNNGYGGDITIASTFASDGVNFDSVRTYDSSEPALTSWSETVIASESSVSENEFSDMVDIDWSEIGDTSELVVAFVQKNQNSVNAPVLRSEGTNSAFIQTLSSFVRAVNVLSLNEYDGVLQNGDYKLFYYENNGVPTFTHPTDGGWKERQLTQDTDVNVPVGGTQLLGLGLLPGKLANLNQLESEPFYAVAVDDTTDNDLHFLSLNISNSDSVLLGGQDLTTSPATIHIEQTTTGGDAWGESIYPDLESAVNRFDFVDNNEGYAVTEDGHVLRTDDGGGNWTEVNQLTNIVLEDIWAPAADTIEVVGQDNGAGEPAHYKSSDGGSTLEEYTPTRDVSNSSTFYGVSGEGDECWITGENGEIVHCFTSTSFSDEKTFRFTVVERLESETYGLVSNVQSTVGTIDTRTSNMNVQLDDIEGKVDSIQSSVNTVDGKVDTINGNVTHIKDQQDDIASQQDDIATQQDSMDSTLQTVLDKVTRILGLSGQNYQITNQSYSDYNGYGKLDSATMKIYGNKNDTLNENNPIGTYTLVTDRNSEGRLIDYKVVQES